MKNNSKNKFLPCFRPPVDNDVMLESRESPVYRTSSRRFSCIPVENKQQLKISETKSLENKSVFLDKSCSEISDDSFIHHPPKRTLSRVIKAVVFETILSKRARHKKCHRQDSHGSKRCYSTCSESSSTGDERYILSLASVDSDIQEETQQDLESTSSSTFVSADCSSPPPESKNTTKSNNSGEAKRKKSGSKIPPEKQAKIDCTGIYLLLISLTITILCGKIYGVLLTSIWLYFLPLWEASQAYALRCRRSTGLKESKRNRENRGHNGRARRKKLA